MKRKNKLQQRTMGEKSFLAIFLVIFLVYGFTLLYPLLWALINAGKTGLDYFENSFNIPSYYLLRNFLDAFTNIEHNGTRFLGMLWNTTWMSITAPLVGTAVSAMASYVVAKYNFPFRNLIFNIAIFIQVVPIVGSGAAAYKFYFETGILDNPALYWLTWASGFGFCFVAMYGYFKSISWEYAEAAIMDGCGNWKIFYKIMVPMARPALVAHFILGFIATWGDYNTSLLYMKSYPTVALGIYLFQEEARFMANSMPLMFAAIIISIIPIILVFIFNQKTIMTNVTAGGLKG